MVSTGKVKHQNKKLLSQIVQFSNDVVFGSSIQATVVENDKVETQKNGFAFKSGSATAGEKSASHTQFTERSITGGIRKEVDSVDAAAED